MSELVRKKGRRRDRQSRKRKRKTKRAMVSCHSISPHCLDLATG